MNVNCERPVTVDENTYSKMISHRNLGLSFLEEERYSDALNEFEMLVNIADEEPLGYANLGLTYMRMSGELQQSEEWLQKALLLAPDHPDILFLLAKVYELTGRQPKAKVALDRILEKHPNHVRTLYQQGLYFSKSNDPSDLKKAEGHFMTVSKKLPGNIASSLRLIELLINDENHSDALFHLQTLQQTLPRLSDDSSKLIRKILDLLHNREASKAKIPLIMLHNLLKPTDIYQGSIAELRGTNGPIAGKPIFRFINTKVKQKHKKDEIPNNVVFTDVSSSLGLSDIFSTKKSTEQNKQEDYTIITLGDHDSDGDQDLFVSSWSKEQNKSTQYLFDYDNGIFSMNNSISVIENDSKDISATFVDYNNDGYLDIYISNKKKDRLYQNLGEGSFEQINIPGIDEHSSKVLFMDFDLEGDLDLFLCTDTKDMLFRNNSDGSYTEIGHDAGLSNEVSLTRDAIYSDLDDDGDGDLFILNMNGENLYYDNLRQGSFKNIISSSGLISSNTPGVIAKGDYNNDGLIDILFTDLSGKMNELYRNLGDGKFEAEQNWDKIKRRLQGIRGYDAEFFDLDNDGHLDILISGNSTEGQTSGLYLFYNNGSGKFSDASYLIPEGYGAVKQLNATDHDNDGDIDIFFTDSKGKVNVLRNDGGNINNYLKISLIGLRTGSSKNNYFGLGAKIEIRAADLYQSHYVDQPIAHFGLGNRDSADVVRVVWSNGVPQNHFKPDMNQTIVETQVLKGSCPYLFGWNGDQYDFITDVLWPSALGMPLGIMAGEPLFAFPNSTDEYLRVPGEKLKMKDGYYSLKFTTELWETPYLDNIKLVAIDHPKDMHVYVNETFVPPPFPPSRVYGFKTKFLPIAAIDGQGNDQLQKISYQDDEHIANLHSEMYQGVTELHDLILTFNDLSNSDSLFLFLQGWLFPTDASINVNLSQSNKLNSIFPFLQVPNENGNWITVVDNMGFPKGKNKTMIIDLTDKFITNDHRVRIRTNMQIYWDHIFIASDVSGNVFNKTELSPIYADLQYRGFSELDKKDYGSPHIPDYYSITQGQKWRDLIGHYTKYGDVLPLLLNSDSKYVIMNAGDEISLQFDATSLPELEKGLRRDFLFYNDGWLKDGDLNTAQGQTVEPIPFHGMSSYPNGAQDQYPEADEYSAYREEYNTRIITTDKFKNSIKDLSNN